MTNEEMNRYEAPSPYERREYDDVRSFDDGQYHVLKPNRFPVVGELMLLTLTLISVFWLPYLYRQTLNTDVDMPLARSVFAEKQSEATSSPAHINTAAFEAVSSRARSVVVYDVANDAVVYEKSSLEKRPLASITKLMTALLVHELLPAQKTITIHKQANTLQDDDYSALVEGDVFTVKNLLDYTLMVSSNEGANILAEAAAKEAYGETATIDDFVRLMNARAEMIGLRNAVFLNPSGLDIDEMTTGATATAEDTAKLLSYIIRMYPDLLTMTTKSEARIVGGNGYIYDAKNTNGIVSDIPGLIASKTGFTDIAGGNLAVAFNIGLGRSFVVVVLGSTKNERFTDVLSLVNATIRAVE